MSRQRKRRRTAFNVRTLDDIDESSVLNKFTNTVRQTDYVCLPTRLSTRTSFVSVPPSPMLATTQPNNSLPELTDDDNVSSQTEQWLDFTAEDEDGIDGNKRQRTASVSDYNYPETYISDIICV